MPIVRVDDKGKRLGRSSRAVAVLSVLIVGAGACLFFSGDANLGIMVCILGNSLATTWNLFTNN